MIGKKGGRGTMAAFELTPSTLTLAFTGWERLGALRTDPVIPWADVADVEVVADPWAILAGLRVGTGLPWVILLGTMLRAGGPDVVAVYRRAPAVVVTLRPGARWQRLIATVPDPEAEVARIRAGLATC
ncbi:MAG: hypothetical protein RLZZ299_170 [Pseudomonadota bacterium]